MGFDFAYPSSFTETKEAGGSGDVANNEEASCSSVPLAVMDMETGFNMIIVKRYDKTCFRAELPRLGIAADNVFRDLLSQLGEPSVGPSTDYEVAGHSASTVSGSVRLSQVRGKPVVYGAASCIAAGTSIACFQFLSSDCRRHAVLSGSTLKFGDAATTPVIPAKFAITCK